MESIEKLRKRFARQLASWKMTREDFDEVDAMLDEIDAEIAERYMELPLDADDVPIHLGNVMDGVGMYDTLRDVTGEVIEVSFNATDSNESVASVALQVWSKDGKSWHRVYIDQYADPYRHHVKPRTLEDVLQCAGVSIAAIEDVAAEIRELLGVEQ